MKPGNIDSNWGGTGHVKGKKGRPSRKKKGYAPTTKELTVIPEGFPVKYCPFMCAAGLPMNPYQIKPTSRNKQTKEYN